MNKRTLRETHVLPPTLAKEAGRRVPPDPERWSEFVFQQFAERHPDLAEMSGGTVDWDRDSMDPAQGFGIGRITVRSADERISVPVVINDFHLQPLDLFEHEGKMYLINSENVGYALREQQSLGDMAFPDRTRFNDRNYKYWLKQAAQSQAEWEQRLAPLEKAARSARPYLDEPLLNLRQTKIAGVDAARILYLEKGAELGSVIGTEYEDGKVVNSHKYDLDHMPESNTVKSAMQFALENGQAVCPMGATAPTPAKIGFLNIQDIEYGAITTPGVYSAPRLTDDGVKEAAVLALQERALGTPAENPVEGHRLIFLLASDDGSVCRAPQESAIGEPTDPEEFECKEQVLPLTDVPRYTQGHMLYNDNGEVAACSPSVTVDRVETTPGGKTRVFLQLPEGKAHYLVEPFLQAIEPLATDDPHYTKDAQLNFIGPNLDFLCVEKTAKLLPNLAKYETLTNQQVIDAAGAGSIMTVKQADWSREKIYAKHGRREYEDPPGRFVARLWSLGVPPDEAGTIIDQAKTGELTVVGVPMSAQAATSPYDQQKVADLCRWLRQERENLIKAAANLNATGHENESTDILSLGLMDEENIRAFTEVLPQYEDTASSLAHLLYMARVNRVTVDEGAVKSALLNLTKVIAALRDLASNV